MPNEHNKQYMEACRNVADAMPHELLREARSLIADLAGTIQTGTRVDALSAANYLVACLDYASMPREEAHSNV